MRSTQLIDPHTGSGVLMVEHLLSALHALGIDNARIFVDGPEIPIQDGSALYVCRLVEEAGILIQDQERRVFTIRQPVFFSQGEVHLVALPSEEFRVSYTLHYPHVPLIGTQYVSFAMDESTYEKEIAPCRTFAAYDEILPFIEQGYIRGGSLDHALLVGHDRIMNPGGTRCVDEMARHKVQDLIGDLALLGYPLRIHVIAIRSGHASHLALVRRLLHQVVWERSL
jgi:UDP-3-O-[3-hydroxymyristoyl] N-acetylglucosamine deacetylase